MGSHMGNEDWTIKAPAKSIIILIGRNQFFFVLFFKDLYDIGKFSTAHPPFLPLPSSATLGGRFRKKKPNMRFPGFLGPFKQS